MKKMFYMIENHPADSRVQIDYSGTCQTLSARMGTGGGNVPMVMFIAKRYAEYEEGLPTLRASGGDAGGSEGLLVLGDRQPYDGLKDNDSWRYLSNNCSAYCEGWCGRSACSAEKK